MTTAWPEGCLDGKKLPRVELESQVSNGKKKQQEKNCLFLKTHAKIEIAQALLV